MSYQSDIGMFVIDGRDINIENFSTGSFANAGSDKFGNINLRSENNDISLISKADDGRIFLVTPNARIQIAPDGAVQIESAADVQITSTQNINLIAQQDVNIKGTNVNIQADANIISDAGTQNSIVGGTLGTIDAAQIHFNTGLNQPIQPVQTAQLEKTSYDE